MTKKPTMDLHLTPTPTKSTLDETEIETPTHTHTTAQHRRLPPPVVPVEYKQCMKNHAATIGGHAVDGCGEYMPASDGALTCAACGCHRNFHRREPTITPPFLDFRRPLQPEPVCRKRFRTKFRQDQKEKMHSFSEKVGWKIHKSDEAAAEELCREVGVSKGVLKVWMHNNKNTFSKKESFDGGDQINGGSTKINEDQSDNGSQFQNERDHFHDSNNASNSSSA